MDDEQQQQILEAIAEARGLLEEARKLHLMTLETLTAVLANQAGNGAILTNLLKRTGVDAKEIEAGARSVVFSERARFQRLLREALVLHKIIERPPTDPWWDRAEPEVRPCSPPNNSTL